VIDFLQAHPDGLILALDELSLYFQATLKRVWFPIGQTPIVRISPKREHIHYYGALDLRTGQELALTLPALSGECTLHFLAQVLTCFPNRPILLLVDRAPWHTAKEVQHFIATQPCLDLLFFPPAYPDLNPQEHVWGNKPVRMSRTTILSLNSPCYVGRSVLFSIPPSFVSIGLDNTSRLFYVIPFSVDH